MSGPSQRELLPGIPVAPEAASTMAGEVDLLFVVLLIVCSAIGLLVAALVIWFTIRYRAGSPRPRGAVLTRRTVHRLELTVAVTLLVAFMGFFVWAGTLYLGMYRGPEDVTTVDVVGRQWMWKIYHGNGVREINTLHVPAGVPIRLRLTSEDVVHSFYVPAFRLKRDALPGDHTYLWFEASRPGTYHLFCAEYCGTAHARMGGRVVVQPRAAHQRWLESRGPEAAESGGRLFREHGCEDCHASGATVDAPALVGLHGRRVPLADGSSVIADAGYLRESILHPGRDIVAGYDDLMPPYAGRLSEAEVQRIVAWLIGREHGRRDEEEAP